MQQQEEYQIVERIPTVEEYLALREAIGWAQVDEQMAARALANALFTVCILHNDQVIGCGRVIGDGGLHFYLQDIIVLPTYQGKGLGKRLIRAILAYLDEHALPGAFIGLMAAQGKSSFYKQFGFAVRPPERPGMFLLREELQQSAASQRSAHMDTNQYAQSVSNALRAS
jgi:GNAT superfamily N-acetyltransferase